MARAIDVDESRARDFLIEAQSADCRRQELHAKPEAQLASAVPGPENAIHRVRPPVDAHVRHEDEEGRQTGHHHEPRPEDGCGIQLQQPDDEPRREVEAGENVGQEPEPSRDEVVDGSRLEGRLPAFCARDVLPCPCGKQADAGEPVDEPHDHDHRVDILQHLPPVAGRRRRQRPRPEAQLERQKEAEAKSAVRVAVRMNHRLLASLFTTWGFAANHSGLRSASIGRVNRAFAVGKTNQNAIMSAAYTKKSIHSVMASTLCCLPCAMRC